MDFRGVIVISHGGAEDTEKVPVLKVSKTFPAADCVLVADSSFSFIFSGFQVIHDGKVSWKSGGVTFEENESWIGSSVFQISRGIVLLLNLLSGSKTIVS